MKRTRRPFFWMAIAFAGCAIYLLYWGISYGALVNKVCSSELSLGSGNISCRLPVAWILTAQAVGCLAFVCFLAGLIDIWLPKRKP